MCDADCVKDFFYSALLGKLQWNKKSSVVEYCKEGFMNKWTYLWHDGMREIRNPILNLNK